MTPPDKQIVSLVCTQKNSLDEMCQYSKMIYVKSWGETCSLIGICCRFYRYHVDKEIILILGAYY